MTSQPLPRKRNRQRRPATWRRNLLANMLAHAWSDIFEGWLRFL
jgi:hypothetical protein